jgi:hypothetical protein
MQKYCIWEPLLTEYTGSHSRSVNLLEEVEASSHEEAYKLFLQKCPHKIGSPVVVTDKQKPVVIEDQYSGKEFGGNNG